MTYRKTIYIVGFGVVMLALIGLSVGSFTSKAPAITQSTTTAWVDDDDPTCGGNSPCFKTIQAAVDTLSEGRVYIRPGIYREHVVLTKNVELIGSGRELVRLEAPDPTRPAILVKGAFVGRISGLGIYAGSVGILVEDAQVFKISHNRITGYTEAGIRLVRSQRDTSISSNELPDSPEWDIKEVSPSVSIITGTAIDVFEGSRATIHLNVIRSFIQIWGKSHATIFEGKSYANIVENLLNSVLILQNGVASITRNRFSPEGSSTEAIMLWPGAEATILANQVQGYGSGIRIAAHSQADIQNNMIFGNAVGIIAGLPKRDSPALPPKFRILRNRIIGNEWGLVLYEGQGLFGTPRAEVKYNWISENGGYHYIYPSDDNGGVQFGRQVRLDFSNNFVINNYYGICPYLEQGESVDPEALQGTNNEIRDNISDLCNADTSYPWPPGFRK